MGLSQISEIHKKIAVNLTRFIRLFFLLFVGIIREQVNEKVMKSFFRDIIENETDKYLRKINLETLCILTCLVKAALEIILDIDNDDDPFLLIIVLHYFSLFYEGSNEILRKIESNKYSFHEEAKFYQVKVTNKFEFLKHLNSCRSLFLLIYSGTIFPFQMYLVPLFKGYQKLGLYNTFGGMLLF
ncbi:hypothetical protein GC102_21940 [Paenibacillus sp. LMG 31460]|uniref:Uncharacterized protein n=1 Tax=Paenibacillus germinis TaxID=2654979 RepID=A0ABX1Z6E4_9BACL|nr:hypothetical protein [Paenibacillus germinis]NOU88394.1 hypothetical protein [Paenibacillus germinis]